jgi:hypothetical protein
MFPHFTPNTSEKEFHVKKYMKKANIILQLTYCFSVTSFKILKYYTNNNTKHLSTLCAKPKIVNVGQVVNHCALKFDTVQVLLSLSTVLWKCINVKQIQFYMYNVDSACHIQLHSPPVFTLRKRDIIVHWVSEPVWLLWPEILSGSPGPLTLLFVSHYFLIPNIQFCCGLEETVWRYLL